MPTAIRGQIVSRIRISGMNVLGTECVKFDCDSEQLRANDAFRRYVQGEFFFVSRCSDWPNRNAMCLASTMFCFFLRMKNSKNISIPRTVNIYFREWQTIQVFVYLRCIIIWPVRNTERTAARIHTHTNTHKPSREFIRIYFHNGMHGFIYIFVSERMTTLVFSLCLTWASAMAEYFFFNKGEHTERREINDRLFFAIKYLELELVLNNIQLRSQSNFSLLIFGYSSVFKATWNGCECKRRQFSHR